MLDKKEKIVPIILSGGSGSRLWPVSRSARPKQFCGLLDAGAMPMQETLLRVMNREMFHPPVVVGNREHRFLIAEQIQRLAIPHAAIVLEPCQRNTAPAIAVAALYVRERYGDDAVMLALPTDHVIAQVEEYLEKVKAACELAKLGHLVTFGIEPEYAQTGYGYIRRGEAMERGAYRVSAFIEKPDLATAEHYAASGEFYWNSGMFLFPCALFLAELAMLQPEVLAACESALAGSVTDSDFIRLEERHFAAAPSVSIDCCVMERTCRAAVIPLRCGWSDTGSWDILWRLASRDERDNAAIGECYLMDVRGCYARSEGGPAIAAMDVENLVIVSTRDAVLVVSRDKAHALKRLTGHIGQRNAALVARDIAKAARPKAPELRVMIPETRAKNAKNA